MNILSLFDGMSCFQIALKEMQVNYTYFASEINKFSIKTTQHNFPSTVQLGDVKEINAKDLPKIDLLIGGSPCQGFSFAGKQLNFNDERSKLFFEFVRILKEVKPRYFLLENVLMKKEHERVISDFLGVEPIMINSNLVSAQTRKRLYWTNIKTEVFDLFGNEKVSINQPENQNIFVKDIIDIDLKAKNNNPVSININNLKIAAIRGRVLNENGIRLKDKTGTIKQYLEVNQTGKSNCLTTVSKDNVVTNAPAGFYDIYNLPDGIFYRNLTTNEARKLQNIPDWYQFPVSNSQIFEMLGNGFTVGVMKHFLKELLQKSIQEVA